MAPVGHSWFSAAVSSVQVVDVEVARADVAIAAHVEAVDALDGRHVQHAVGRAVAAGDALVGIELPDHFVVAAAAAGEKPAAEPKAKRPATRTPSARKPRRSVLRWASGPGSCSLRFEYL